MVSVKGLMKKLVPKHITRRREEARKSHARYEELVKQMDEGVEMLRAQEALKLAHAKKSYVQASAVGQRLSQSQIQMQNAQNHQHNIANASPLLAAPVTAKPQSLALGVQSVASVAAATQQLNAVFNANYGSTLLVEPRHDPFRGLGSYENRVAELRARCLRNANELLGSGHSPPVHNVMSNHGSAMEALELAAEMLAALRSLEESSYWDRKMSALDEDWDED